MISYSVMLHVQDDYRRTITELDEKEFISLRLVIIEMRNHYVSCASVSDNNMFQPSCLCRKFLLSY